MIGTNTICIVDDDLTFRYLAERTLKSSEKVKKVKVFKHGGEAIQYIEAIIHANDELPDIILLDIDMPIMDGWEFLKEYLLLKPLLSKKIRIYVVTSSIDPDDLIRAKSTDVVVDYIIKPVTRRKFMEMIDRN